MNTVTTQLFTTANTYMVVLAIPQQTPETLVNIFQTHALPIYQNQKKFGATNVNKYFAITSIGKQLVTPLTDMEALECVQKKICYASQAQGPVEHTPCGLNTDHEDKCSYQ